jgi:hypothetical protein
MIQLPAASFQQKYRESDPELVEAGSWKLVAGS